MTGVHAHHICCPPVVSHERMVFVLSPRAQAETPVVTDMHCVSTRIPYTTRFQEQQEHTIFGGYESEDSIFLCHCVNDFVVIGKQPVKG
jgi:hypothetical protein